MKTLMMPRNTRCEAEDDVEDGNEEIKKGKRRTKHTTTRRMLKKYNTHTIQGTAAKVL